MMNMIREESIYAEIINLSGKQRMLSQNTALMTTRAFLQGECDLSDHRNKLVVVMEEEHDYILTRVHTERMKEIHRDLDPHVRAYLVLFRIRPESDPSGYVREVQAASHELLPILNNAVYAVPGFEKERFILMAEERNLSVGKNRIRSFHRRKRQGSGGTGRVDRV